MGYVYEDKKGNILTSSQTAQGWVLSRYDERLLSNKYPPATEIKPKEGMICWILEANDGSIWFGASKGAYRYDGSTITDFKGKQV